MPTKQDTIQLKFASNQWSMKHGGGPWQLPPNYPQLIVGENQVGLFVFEIAPSTNATFSSNPFTQKGGVNSKADFPDQFLVFPMNSKKLIVVDTNENKGGGHYAGGTYDYQLNFVGATPLDPIITNTGCCRLYSQAELISYSLAAASLLLLYILVLRPWLARRAAASPPPNTAAGGAANPDSKKGPGPL